MDPKIISLASIARTCLIMSLRPLRITDAPLLPAVLHRCTCNIYLERSMISWNIAARHSSSIPSVIPMRNLLISSLLLDTREVAYLHSLTNFREYFLTVIDPYLRLINSSTLSSLILLRKNLSRKVVQKNSQETQSSAILPHLASSLCNILKLIGSQLCFLDICGPP